MPDGDVQVDTEWLRTCAKDCEGTESAIRGELTAADGAVSKMRSTAEGWAFLGSLDEMSERWEALNKLLRDELSRAAEEFSFSSQNYRGIEHFIERRFHEIRKGWDEVLDYD
jgi:hypothetical protein